MINIGIDKLELLRGNSLNITDSIMLGHPKLGDIVDLGYSKYMQYLTTLISTSLDVADILLYEMEVWYEDIKDEWKFFIQKCMDNTNIINVIIKDSEGHIRIERECITVEKGYEDAINFFFGLTGKYIITEKKLNNDSQLILNNVVKDEYGNYIMTDSSFKFTKYIYEMTTEFLKNIHWIVDDYDFTHGGTKRAKKYLLLQHYKDRQKIHKKKSNITLDSIVSSLISFGHSIQDIWNYPIYLVYDQYYRRIKINEYNSTISALQNGCIDTKKNPINWEKINWAAVIK